VIWLTRLDPDKLQVRFEGVQPDVMTLPRRYTLTHSDKTGDLYLTISREYDHKQISGFYTRIMRDEVLAEWQTEQDTLVLHVHCHVSGGFVFGTASLRESIFRRELPLVLEAIRHGDRELAAKDPNLDQAQILVHFNKSKPETCKTEPWGHLGDYKLQ
jgi:magnesium dechelatase